jgi:hypothetical protein
MTDKEVMKLALAYITQTGFQTGINEVIYALRDSIANAEVGPNVEGAIVNGRVYADRLEQEYKFECEAGPLHLCADWVEFRRCFEWLAEHTTPPQRTEQGENKHD